MRVVEIVLPELLAVPGDAFGGAFRAHPGEAVEARLTQGALVRVTAPVGEVDGEGRLRVQLRGDALPFPGRLREVQHRDAVAGAVGPLRAEPGVEGVRDEAAPGLQVGVDAPAHAQQVLGRARVVQEIDGRHAIEDAQRRHVGHVRHVVLDSQGLGCFVLPGDADHLLGDVHAGHPVRAPRLELPRVQPVTTGQVQDGLSLHGAERFEERVAFEVLRAHG